MKITAGQKQTIIPLAIFIISTGLFIWGLGSIFVLLAVPFMVIPIGILSANIGPAVGRWFARDGWK
ncbi:hypothetical protein [Pseudomonas typographi]|uniref:hypothetical protein n=1 Tax=Pseudomonas typographi TaxID=2715964 RepID=UPI0016880312|nr:hypothetical protein [Pseudomonas typographi]MBD1555201.1 hypothetical protein [Pseudomonas typographi]